MRLSFFLVAGLALIAFVALGSATAPEEPAQDDELRRLLKARLEAAWGEMEATTALYKGGRVSLTDTCAAIQRFSKAGRGAAQTSAYRLKVCAYAFQTAKTIEEVTKAKYESDAEPVQAIKLATYTRLDMEIKLHAARQSDASARARSKADDSDLPPLPPPAAPTKQST